MLVLLARSVSKAALVSLGYEEVALEDFWGVFLQELDNLPSMEMSQLEVGRASTTIEGPLPPFLLGSFCYSPLGCLQSRGAVTLCPVEVWHGRRHATRGGCHLEYMFVRFSEVYGSYWLVHRRSWS